MKIAVREMTLDDYEQMYDLWTRIKGFHIREIEDSKEGIARFLKKNPNNSVVAELDGKIVGTILCGHDGRRGSFYHVCVDPLLQKHGIAGQMVEFALASLKRDEITNVCLIAFKVNDIGNHYWKKMGWKKRDDIYYYNYTLEK